MWNRKELKTNAKAALKGKLGKAILAIVIVFAIIFVGAAGASIFSYLNVQSTSEINSDTNTSGVIIGFIAYIAYIAFMFFIAIPISVGLYKFYMKNRKDSAVVGDVFSLIKNCKHIAWVNLVMGVKVYLWTLLFFIPGIIKAYEYSQINFILAENPNMPTKRAFQISKAMTKGNKWHLFVLDLSFILWETLASIVWPVYLYLAPYMMATQTEAYYKLKADAVTAGSVTLEELPDIA